MPRVNLTRQQELESYIYRRLEYAMALYNLTQREAGEAIGIKQNGFSQAFNGRTLSVKQLCGLLDRMGLTVCIESK